MHVKMIEQKGMTFDHEFCYFILLVFFSLFIRWEEKRPGEKNNQSRRQKSCLSARSVKRTSHLLECWDLFQKNYECCGIKESGAAYEVK